MKVLIAEDDPVSRRLLEAHLKRNGHDVITTEDGEQAWEAVQADESIQLAVLDWMMPKLDGVEVCRRVRGLERSSYIYIIFLSAKGQKADVVVGLDAGADDYVVKPFDPQELQSRLSVGQRVLGLESDLAGKIDELERALAHVKTLQGLLPICMFCKKIRDDSDTWHRLESYIEQNSQAMFTHSLCQECLNEHYPKNKSKNEQPVG